MERNEDKQFIRAIIYIASIDDNIDESEKEFFYEVGNGMNITHDEINEICQEINSNSINLKEILSGFETDETKHSLLKLLIGICHVDGKYSDKEKEGMMEICNMLGVDAKILKKLEMEHYTKAGKQMFKKGFGVLKTGMIFAGEKGIQSGKFVASGIANGVGKVGSKLSEAIASAKQLREENKKLRDELKKTTITESVKQKIILQLNSKSTVLNEELKREKARNDKNEEIIKLLLAQLEDLEKTIEVAETAKTA